MNAITTTALTATHCAICHRALRDAASVERGVGPDCAKKYGLGEAQEPCNLDGARAYLHKSGLAAAYAGVATKASAAAEWNAPRDAANVLVHFLAVHPRFAGAAELVTTIRHLGFVRLADRLAENLPKHKELAKASVINVTYEGDRMLLSTHNLSDDAFQAFLDICRAMPGRRWLADRKLTSLPVSARRAFWTACGAKLPAGITIRSEQGQAVTQGPEATAAAIQARAEERAEREAIRDEPPAAARIRVMCGRCGGLGYIPSFAHVEGGRCFRCGGQSANSAAA